MRLDYTLYVLAALLLIITVVPFVIITEEPDYALRYYPGMESVGK